jgi:hypothetical protein
MNENTAAPREVLIEVSKADRLIRVKLSGRPQQQSIVKMLGDLNVLAEQDSSLSVLIDETELDPRFVGPGDMERFVAAWRSGSALRSTRLAVFVSSGAMFGLNRQFEALTDGDLGVSVFSDRGQAEAWLRERPNRRRSPRADVEPATSVLTV